MAEKLISENRQARRDYDVLERHEAGIALTGTEVKSLRAGSLTLKDSYVEERRGELFLMNAHIPPYSHGNIHNHEPERPRKLLMHKVEIVKLGARVMEKRLTMVPLKVYFKKGKVKVEIGVCKGRQHADQRNVIMNREIQRDIDRAMVDAAKGRKKDDR